MGGNLAEPVSAGKIRVSTAPGPRSKPVPGRGPAAIRAASLRPDKPDSLVMRQAGGLVAGAGGPGTVDAPG